MEYTYATARDFAWVLRGTGAEALCTVKATRLGVVAAHEVDPQSIDALSPKPIPVPDGNYDLFLEGKCYHVRLENGHLLSRGF
jgi:hypothetical protein